MNVITIPNINNYTLQIIDNTLILTKIIPYISEEELFKQDLKNSNILECKINNVDINIKKYKTLLLHLYSDMNTVDILANTILNIKQEQINDKGFNYYPSLNLSIQGSESIRTLREILNIIKFKKHNIELKLKLKNNIIEFKTNI